MTTDLHAHTTASDGVLAPADLLALAHERGITTLAITDHDTTDGIAPAQAAADKLGITLIPGIELSAETEQDGDIHMLGYFIDVTNAAFQSRLADFRENRYHRGRAIVRKLNELGLSLSFEAVEAEADGAPITRPHIARAMVKAGHVQTTQDAFDQYIADDAPAYVNRERMAPEEAVALIRSAGGVAVMAHPGRVKTGETVLRRLAAAGVDGVELYHPNNDERVRAYISAIATDHNLITTGGSDFHKPNADGSIRLGAFNPPEGAVARLRAKATSQP
jgi:predicted metal-dependent phosphoesterase TrpH